MEGSQPATLNVGHFDLNNCEAPERGKANQCLLKFLAKQLGVKKNAVSIISGKTSPVKHVQVSGISTDTLLNKLGLNK